jgi:hypothetical protein
MFWRVRTNLQEYELRYPMWGASADRAASRQALEELLRHREEPDVRKVLLQTFAFMLGRAGGAGAPQFAAHHERAFLEQMRTAAFTGPLVVKHLAPQAQPPGPTHQDMIDAAFRTSRSSLRVVIARMASFEAAIDRAQGLDGMDKILAIQQLGRLFARDIAVVGDKLRVGGDPLSPPFRTTLGQARQLMAQNLSATSGIIDQGSLGRCAPTNWSPPGVPFAATTPSDPDPRVSVCTPFFAQSAEMQRDVVTHEFFHLLGLIDASTIANAADALGDANTMAQVVAYLHDRRRTRDSSNMSQPSVPYPSP